MKHIVLFSFVLLMGSCALLNPPIAYEKALAEATAQRWSGGARGSGRGVIFTVKFYTLPKTITADTLIVNNISLEATASQVGDTTYITSSYMAENGDFRTLANDTTYSGSLILRMEGQKHALTIKEFKLMPSLNYP